MKDFVSIDRLLKERGISLEEMKSAADLTEEKLSPEPENGSQEALSQERRERILDQIEAGNAPKRRRNPLRVAGVAAALLAVSFLLVLYGPRAMASIRTWIKKAYGKTVEYEFLGEPEEKPLPFHF